MMLSLAACATSGPNPTSDEYCRIAKPTYLSRADVLTDATLRKIITDNETGQKLCGWKPPN